MNKKILFIIVALFTIQVGVFYFVNKNEVFINEKSSVYFGKYKPDNEGVLDLSHQGLAELPEGVLESEDLRVIRLDDNNFTEFPEELLAMPNLTTISLLNNKIKRVDLSEANIQCNLNYLHLSDNKISEISGIERLQHLDFLYLDNNKLTDIPFLKIQTLRSVSLKSNLIQELEMERFYPNLEMLHLDYNEIETILIDDINYSQLNILSLNNNEFEIFPSAALKFQNLKALNLKDCGMNVWKVDKSIVNRQSIYIDLSENNFRTFDANLETILPNLKSLLLYNSELESVHINHAQLEILNIRNNDIDDLKVNTPRLGFLHIDNKNIENDLPNINAPKLRQITIPPSIMDNKYLRNQIRIVFQNAEIVEESY